MLGAGGTGFDQADEASVSKVASSESLDAVDLNRRTITNIDFRRGESGEGRVEISFRNPMLKLIFHNRELMSASVWRMQLFPKIYSVV